MTDNESKVWRVAILAGALLLVGLFCAQLCRWEHEEKMQALENDRVHPGIWRK